MATTEITIADLTASTLAGAGVFDVLMRSSKVHLDDQFNADRIRGPEYSEVYLGQLQSSMRTALEFIALQKRLPLEARLLELQVELASEQVLTAKIERTLVQAQVDKLRLELELVPLQKLQIEAQTKLIDANLVNAGAEKLQIEANTAKTNAEIINVPKQGLLLDAQLVTATQQGVNAEVEKRVLEGQVCKLQAEFDYTKQNVLKAGSETTLLVQKLATEKAQILGLGVDEDSVIGKQKRLYAAQTAGFQRDAEQKAAGLYMEYWKTARMTDDAWQANATNGLDDVTMGKVLAKLRSGVDVTG